MPLILYAAFSVPLLRHLLQSNNLFGTQCKEDLRDIHHLTPTDSIKVEFSKKVCEHVELFIFGRMFSKTSALLG